MFNLKTLTRLSNTIKAVKPQNFNYKPLCSVGHVKNMLDENLKYQIEQIQNGEGVIENTDRIYKPSHTIEFNRVGEVLLYSCDPNQHLQVYLKYPYVLYESFAPILLWQWFYNPLDLGWFYNNICLWTINLLWIPRMWYWRSFNYKIRKMSLLRGGKVVKIETNTLANDWNTSWVETYQFKPLTQDQKNFDNQDEADFLEEAGQLKYELAVQVDHYQEMGTTTQDVVLEFMKEGTVHEPELFEAAMKGFNIDTSDFVINTADNFRSREGHYNQ